MGTINYDKLGSLSIQEINDVPSHILVVCMFLNNVTGCNLYYYTLVIEFVTTCITVFGLAVTSNNSSCKKFLNFIFYFQKF